MDLALYSGWTFAIGLYYNLISGCSIGFVKGVGYVESHRLSRAAIFDNIRHARTPTIALGRVRGAGTELNGVSFRRAYPTLIGVVEPQAEHVASNDQAVRVLHNIDLAEFFHQGMIHTPDVHGDGSRV